MEAATARLPCCYCGAGLDAMKRYGVTEDGRNVCARCVAERKPDLLTMHYPERKDTPP